jgi:predicted  nucleic acid-binding Zn-ribbon protein
MDKINEIEQLQHAINSLESRVATLSNEVLKLNALYEQSNDTVTELNSSIQSIQIRLDCEINLKLQLQEKCERLNA